MMLQFVKDVNSYMGNYIMPPLFGLIANHLSISLFPIYLLAILAVMVSMYRLSCKKTA